MKRQHKVISFILVLSLLFSSLIFTAGAESVESLDDVNKTEFYEPTATFTKVTPNSKGTAYGEFFGHIGLSGVYDVTGDTKCLTTYVAETYNGESTNRYLMLTPTQEAINDHTIWSDGHSQINIGTDTIVWRNDDSKYYVFELDIATESNFLDMDFEVVTRYNDANTSGSWGKRYSPSSNFQMLISEGGMFHHVTFVGDLDNNKLYVFVDNQLVDVVDNALMGTDLHNKYMAGTEAIILRSMRIQKSPAQNSIIADSSIYLGRAEMRILGENDEDNYADNIRVVLKYGDLSAWGENNYYPEEQSYVPDVIEINGVKYNNTVAASNALQTFKLGTKAKVLRSCYGGNINVNCDAEFTVPMEADINIVAGDDVEVVKGDGNIWLSVIKTFKHSAKVVSKNPSYFASSVIYPALDNLITNVKQENAINSRTFKDTEFADLITDLDLTAEEQALFTFNESANTYTLNISIFNGNANKTLAEKFRNHSIDGSIVRTDGGNEYLIVQDNSGKAGDFPLNVHYQVNAQITPTKLSGHNYIVFEQDIYSESQFINVYSVFNVRTPSDKSLSSTQVFADKVSITPEKWYHLTYIGEVATGDSYIFLDGKCVAKVKSGLYDTSAIGMVAVSMGKIGDSSRINSYSAQEFADFAAQLTAEQKTDCVNNMVLHTFRTMQIAGENKSGEDLTPDMSAASDNYYLRWADESSMSTLINKISNDYEDNNVIDGSYNISDWSANIYGSSYKAPERAVIATINGVEYYDTTHINEVLNNASYTKALQEVVLYREYVGTIVVNCRATVKLNGVNSHVVFNEYDAETNPTGCIVDRSQNPIVVYMQTPEDGTYDMDYPIASVDGVLYYADGAKAPDGTLYANTESDLKALLEMPNDTQRIVTFLREPTTEITIISNAQVDANGLNLDKITLGNQDCVVAEGTNVSTVINLTGTTVVAVMNGVQYLANQIAELQAAVTASNEVTISFYRVPSTPIKITSVANIKTNGILNDGTTQDELFTTDEINFVISKIDSVGAEYDYTIIQKIRTATVEVRVVKDGTTISTVKVDGDFGTDIAELLTNKGLMSGVFVVDGEQLNVTNWDVTPSGIINKENNGSESAYVYTATVDNSRSITVTEKYAYVTASGITQSNSESDVRNWFSDSGNGTIVFFDDLTVTTASSITLNGSGKSVQLNGHSINFETMLNSQGNVAGIHGFVPGDNATVNFYGDGTINYLTNAGTEALLFTNYTFAGTITFNNITINASASIARLRGGNAEFNGCDINSYNYSSTKMFELGEQYNSGASAIPMTLILKNCDIDFRYYNTSKVYPVINSKIVTSHTDPERTVIIFGCNIKTQGALVAAYECADSNATPNAYLQSNLKVYVSESSIMAKSITTGTIKANSIYFCDDVRTNVVSTANITFANDILAAKVSDGLYHVLYTSHDYATITWSDGVTEHWASGSTPNSYEHRFDGITAGGLTEDQNKVSYNSTGSSFPFGLLANLTLSDRIGFNVYVPTTLKNGTSVSTSDVKIYLDGKEISANCYPGTSTVRTSIVAAATGYGDGYCYDYTLTLAPQEAAKSFTIVIVYGGQCVSRTVSIADYATSLINKGTNEKNLALLSVTLAYIEEATKFAGYTVDMSKIKSLRSTLGTKTATIQAPTDPEITHGETEADFSKYFAGVQLNVKENGAFRFRLADGVSADGFKFYIANDKNDGYELREHKVIAVNNEIYLELSLRAFEMARSIKIVNGGEYDLYSLYQCYNATKTMANATIDVQGKAYTTGKTYEYKAALTLIETTYHYASICDKYLDKNATEYQPAN